MSIDAALRKALLQPRSVALIGASADNKKNNSRPQRYLQRYGYPGRIVPVNPSRSEVMGLQAFPDLRAVPGTVDHAFIMVPAVAVPEVIAQCCERKVKVATLFSAGFAELGEEGQRRQRDMVQRAHDGGLRLLGPNCQGVINIPDRIPLTVSAVVAGEPLVAGPLSLISQSGSITGCLMSRAQARGLGFSKLISVGNECDLGVGELTDMLVDDEDTKAILLFLETFRDADKLAIAARRANQAGKPVIAFKLGRSGVGRSVANSHTGALTGPDEVANAFFREHGIIRVDTFEGLFETAQLVAGHQPARGKRVSVVTGTGGAAAMVVDRLGVLGAEVVGPSPQVISRLASQDIAISDAAMTDIPMGQSEGGRYAAILSALMASDHSDAVVSVIGSSAQNPEIITGRVLNVGQRDQKPLAVFLAPLADQALVQLQSSGVASFRTPESCADAVNAYLNWHRPGARPQPNQQAVEGARYLAQIKRARLNEQEASGLFQRLGIAIAQQAVVDGSNESIDFPGPYAVKLLSPDVPHKTDAGMVELNVEESQVMAIAQRLQEEARRKFPQARIDGVLVQAMERGLAEVILGFRRDPEVGPVVVLGMGGIVAELQQRIAVRIAPVTLDTAHEMLAEVRELELLRGFRNLPRGDLDALAQAICAMSMLAHVDSRRIVDAEINPLIIKEQGHGVVAVDGLVVFE